MKMLIKRMYAGLIDITLVGIIIYILYIFYFYSGIKFGDFQVDMEWFRSEYEIVFYAAMLVYYIISELFDYSPGKRIFKIRINYGKYVKTARILRPVLKLSVLLILPLAVISLFTKDNYLFYDYLLGTTIEEAKYERRDLR